MKIHQRGLAHAGDIVNQHVPAGKQAGEYQADLLTLADDGLAALCLDLLRQMAEFREVHSRASQVP